MLLLKLLLVPALVGVVTLAVRRWGLHIGGLLTGLPMVAAPTLTFYAVEQGYGFAANAARATLLGIAATGAFCAAYAHAARHAPWPVSVLCGWTAFAAAAAIFYRIDAGAAAALAIAICGLVIGGRLLPRHGVIAPPPIPPRWDIPLRMTAAAAAVVLLTGLAALLGERLSGILAAFPVVTVVLTVFTHAQHGHASVTAFFRGLLRGLLGFALFCLVFSTALGPLGWGLTATVAAALASQLALQSLMLWRMTRRGARPATAASERAAVTALLE